MSIYKVRVTLEPRGDGGLRVWSVDVPELVLSHPDPDAVLADVARALEVILSERLGRAVEVAELELLPSVALASVGAAAATRPREFVASVAA